MATNLNVIKTITIRGTAEGVSDVERQLGKVADQMDNVTVASTKQEKATQSLEAAYRRLQVQNDALVRQQQQQAQALQAANDNAEQTGKSFVDMAASTLELTTHLKLAAAAAYIAVPAFRSLTNQTVVSGLGLLGANANLVAGGVARVGSALGPAISFITRLSIPILAAVAAFKLFEATFEKGSELLDQFGTEGQRKRFGDIADTLKELTKLQTSDLTIPQQQQAGELARRLEDAKFTISQFADLKIPIEAALHLQSIWVSIVETIAKGVSLLPQFVPPQTGAPPAGPFFDPMSGVGFGGTAKGNLLQPSTNVLRQQGLSTLAAGMGGGFAGRFAALGDKPEKQVADLTSEFERLSKSIERSTAAMEADAQTVGKSTAEQTKLRTELRLREAAEQDIIKNGGKMEDYLGRINDLSNRAAKAAEDLALAQLKGKIDFGTKTAFISKEDVQIAQELAGVWGNDVPNALASSEAAQIRFNNRMRELTDIFQDFITDFIKGMAEGKNITDALSTSMKSLGSALAGAGAKSIAGSIIGSVGTTAGQAGTGLTGALGSLFPSLGTFAGPAGALAGVGLGAGIAALGSIFGESAKKEQEHAQAVQQATQALIQANEATRGFVDQLKDLNETATGSELAIKNAEKLRDQAIAAAHQQQQLAIIGFQQGNIPFAQALQAFNDAGHAIEEAGQQFDEFRKNTIEKMNQTLQQGINSATGRAFLNNFQQIVDTVKDAEKIGADSGLTQQFLQTQAQQLVDQQKLTGDNFQLLLDTFPELNGLITEFNDSVTIAKRSVDELRKASESLDDRMLAATTDANTLQGALLLFDRRALREREAEMEAGGENLVQLEAVQAQERINIIEDFNQKSIELERQRVDQLNSFARDIATYVNSLFSGPGSALSPSGRLSQAQTAFQNQLALANIGNIDAISTITKFAEDYRQAAQAFYGSGTSYQNILSQISSSLLAIPAVSGSTDPVVQALVNTVTPAIQGTTSAVNTGTSGTTGAVNSQTTTQSTEATTQANLLTASNTLSTSANNLITATNNLITSTNTLVTTSNNTLTAIQNLNTTANSQLTSINSQTAVLLSIETHMTSADNKLTDLANINTKTNSIDTHSAHMFAPSGSINFNLAKGGFVGEAGAVEYRLATGGGVGSDTVPAWLTPGEFVVNRSAAQRYGGLLMTLNSGGFAGPTGTSNTFARIESLLAQIVALEAEGNTMIGHNTAVTVKQSREARFAARKGYN